MKIEAPVTELIKTRRETKKLRNNKKNGGRVEKEKDEQKISNESVCFPNEVLKGRLGCRIRGSERKRFVF